MKEKKLRGNPRKYQNLPYVKKSHMMALGFGDLGYSLVSGTVATYIMSFGTMVVGLPGYLMGIAISLGTIFDAVSDPIIGYLSDNTKNKLFGKRHLWMLIGLIGLMATSIFIWYIPEGMSNKGKFVWFAVGLIVLRTFNTFFYTPVGAFSVEVSNDYNERTTIQAFRSIGYIIGMILPVVIMGTFQNKYTQIDELGNIIKGQFFAGGYRDFAWVSVGVCFVTSVFMYIMTFFDVKTVQARQIEEEAVKPRASLKKVLTDFFGVLKSGDMRSIIFGYAISMMSATLIISIGFHVFTFTFELATTQMYILMGALLLMTVAGQPLWPLLSKKLDKKKSMMIGLGISLVGCVLLFICWLLRDEINVLIATSKFGMAVLLPPLMIAGMGTGVLYSMPMALIGDIVVKNSVDDKSEKTGTYAGMMTFAYKVSQSLTQLISGQLLTIIGFKEGSHTQSYETSSALGLILCVGITVVIIIGLIIFATMKVDKKEITRLMQEQDERVRQARSGSCQMVGEAEVCASEDENTTEISE